MLASQVKQVVLIYPMGPLQEVRNRENLGMFPSNWKQAERCFVGHCGRGYFQSWSGELMSVRVWGR